MKIISGGVCAAQGFTAGSIRCGVKESREKDDVALILSDCECTAAATYTLNRVKAAPLYVTMEHLEDGVARAVIANAGNANACAPDGMENARRMAKVAAKVLGVDEDDVVVVSTGVIGQRLPVECIEQHLPEIVLDGNGSEKANRAIMTTDTHSKEYAVSYVSEAAGHAGNVYTVGGMCKGSGMIMPNMATMIAVITTDAPVESAALHTLLLSTVKQTFNKVTVDSDTSTNDTCIMLASGAAAADAEGIVEGTDAFDELAFAVHEVCESLARNIAADGEGASKLVTVNVTGAANDEEADIAARAVANSPLVKTCIAGHDCNWGRVAMALGKCGVTFNQEDVSIDMMGMPVCRDGLTVPFDEDEALRRFEAPEIVISADLGAGDAATTVWTCDLTHEYISINGDYRS